ncbi:NTF2-like protein [Nadsonia fulvescens var. elongata DSM 6958]|uniref:NTF2-like protein n=1 Tax=Nadsonia fulvescens var. elongata DSM 6958 TaxID=857566 RepID=A0A1E3PQQ5_9ASCO|nr:NTF2-like protein [Nadsonia fulvescens var. elongata DSM 6958]
MSYRGRGGRRGNNNSNGRNNNSNINNNGMNQDSSMSSMTPTSYFSNSDSQAMVEIQNWQGGSKEDLINFINRKTKARLHQGQVSGSIFKANVSINDGKVLEKWSGVKFAGGNLTIKVAYPSSTGSGFSGANGDSSTTLNAIQILEQFIDSRYVPQASLLNLQNMKGDPILVSNNLFATASTSSKMFPALMKIVSNKGIVVDSVDLSNNNLQEITGITTLSQAFPNLKNLCLSDNQIARIKNLDAWRHKFPQLRELILVNNPVVKEPGYQNEILKMFPRLVMLDGQMVRDETQIDNLRFPSPISQVFFEDDEIQNLVLGFLGTYFDLYDRDRTQVLPLYDQESMFSLSVSGTSPRVIASDAINAGPQNWSPYLSLSRNLIKVTTANARQTRLFTGPEKIHSVFQKLPATRHDITQSEKFSIESWRISGIRQPGDTAIVIVIHGEFNELQSKNTLRSFDRTFVLIPGANGSMVVASDMLVLRPWSGYDAWKNTDTAKLQQQQQQQEQQQQQQQNNVIVPGAPVSNPGSAPLTPQSSGTPNNIPAELQGLNEQQIMIVSQLMKETNLNAQFSRMCLEQCGFDPMQALHLFRQSSEQNMIPPEAFIR